MRKKKNIIDKSIILFTLSFFCFIFMLSGLDYKRQNKRQEPPKLRSPFRIALLPQGDLLVSDPRLKVIFTFSKKTLKVKDFFTINGKPLGVAYALGHVYVGNATEGCIEVFTLSGKLLRNIGKKDSIKRPQDISIDTKLKKLFVIDGHDKVVKVFSLKGTWLFTISGNTGGTKLLENPAAIALDPEKKEIFVSDYGDFNNIKPRIQIFDYKGELVNTIRGTGSFFGVMGMGIYKPIFSRPQGIQVNSHGSIYLVDCYSSEILIFDRITLKKVAVLGGFGDGPDKMQLPLDLVIDPKTKDVFVTNNRLAKLTVFRGGGE